ncbi:hydroquinone glucosyltransferase-like [Dendrobium catenatum]|uniref:Glycosyltransferase n=1 Tax=Dendrobium catenatum TaxID=906689 RepID=A0A2I0VXQ2_9ASPA|nr:hydroquinone glucosyltransferase-like [Dendrobium catenatum]PKU68169.1 Hydroquinone glucosyltransferase [Dendrobium catenatum]
MAEANPKAHVVLLPSPGIGHLTPLAQLAKRLVLNHKLSATIITFSDLSSGIQQSLLSSLPNGVTSVSLPAIPLDDLSINTHIVTRLSVMISRSVPFLRETLLTLQKTRHIVAYIIDHFGGETLSLASELSIPRYIFCTTNFFYLSFLLNLPSLYHDKHDDHNPNQFLFLPGCTPLHRKDYSRSAIDKNSEVFQWMLRHSKHHDQVDGIMVNSFEAMEGGPARFLKERGNGKPPVFSIGPLTCNSRSDKRQAESGVCLRWLDQQPGRSVLFIAFGSGGTLSFKQTKEMALGLEMSGQRFLWVVRKPVDVDASSAYFNQCHGKHNPLGFLPEGFVERMKGKGMVVPSWAPQEEILAHGAIGGFLSHCGWNSTLESIVNGVPMITWPLYSEQPMNAVMLVEGAKVALRPTVMNNDEVVGKEAIADVVKDLMEGEGGKDVRKRMHELKDAAMKAVGADGSSNKALAQMVNKWKTMASN